MATKTKQVEPEATVSKFNKKQIISAEKYKDKIDLVNSLLIDERLYSLAEVDNIIEKFLKGKVK